MIGPRDLQPIIDENDFKKLAVYSNRLQRYWCTFIKNRDMCHMPCASNEICAGWLSDKASNLKAADSPGGLMTWLIRTRKAQIQEQGEVPQIARTGFGEVVDPYEAMRASL